MQTPNGILPVDKPAGWTSFDVLAKLRGALGTRKLGHSGTLDPMATGVLAVFIGKATSAADRQLDHDKTYEATLRLGLRTDTGDVTGTTLETAPVTVGEAELRAVLPQFRGDRMQLPPMYSAVKINGQPLYKAARVLAEEIGDALGVPATLSALRRTQAGVFSLAQCHTLPEILAAAESGELETNGWVLPIESVFAPLPALHVNSGVKAHLLNGCPTSHYAAADGRYRTYDETGAFLGLANVEGGVLKVEKLFCERG